MVPNDAVALAVAINAVVDLIATASNMTCLQVEVVTVSGKLGMLDGECLKKRDKGAGACRASGEEGGEKLWDMSIAATRLSYGVKQGNSLVSALW